MFKKSLIGVVTSALLALDICASNTTGQILGAFEVTKEIGKIDNTGAIGNIAGDELGEFDNPTGMVMLSDGSFWIADKDNHRIQHFSKFGTALDKVGISDSYGNGISGTNDGEFNAPWYIAKDSSDNIYVTDHENKRIQKFDKDGNHLLTITNEKFGRVLGIDVDSVGNIWAADYDNHYVWKLDTTGAIIGGIGYVSSDTHFSGTATSQFDNPYDLVVDSDDSLWVVDRDNYRVQHFNSSGEYIEHITMSSYARPLGLALDGDNILVTYYDDYYTNHIYKYSKSNIVDGKATIKAIYSGYSESRDIVVDDGIYWIVDYTNHKVVRAVRNGSYEMTKVSNIGKTNDDGDIVYTNGDFAGSNTPEIIITDKDNNIWVKDYYSIKKYDNLGNYILGLGKKDSNNNFTGGSFTTYTDYMDSVGEKLYILSDTYDVNNVYSSSKNYVGIFDLDGNVISEIDISSGYTGFAVNSDGTFWVSYANGLIKYDVDGSEVQKVGLINAEGSFTYGTGDLQFYNIKDIAINSQDEVYVYDDTGERIQVLNSDGTFKTKVSNNGWNSANIFIDNEDNVWLSDETKYFKKLDKDLNFLFSFSSRYSYDLEEMFSNNLGHESLAFDSNGNLWMADTEYDRISKYTFGNISNETIAPKVDMTISINDGMTVTFDANAYDEDGEIVSYDWSFGDGSSATVASTSHVYNTVGTYTIGLIVTDNEGIETSLEQVIKVTGSGSTVISSSGQGCPTTTLSYSQSDIDLAKDEQKEQCKLDPSSCGIVDSAGIETVQDQCKLDPESCGITNVVDKLDTTSISSLSNGWNLVGSSYGLDDMSIFDEAHSVWYFKDDMWKIYSSNELIKQSVNNNPMIEELNTIEPNSGFWIMK